MTISSDTLLFSLTMSLEYSLFVLFFLFVQKHGQPLFETAPDRHTVTIDFR